MAGLIPPAKGAGEGAGGADHGALRPVPGKPTRRRMLRAAPEAAGFGAGSGAGRACDGFGAGEECCAPFARVPAGCEKDMVMTRAIVLST